MITFEQYEQAISRKKEIQDDFFKAFQTKSDEELYLIASNPTDEEKELDSVISQYLKENPINTRVEVVVKNGGGKNYVHEFMTGTTKEAVKKIRELSLSPDENTISITINEKKGEVLFRDIEGSDSVRISENLHLPENDIAYLLYLTDRNTERIKRLRARADMSRRAFHEAFGVPERTLEDWENGKRTPPAYVVNLLEMAIENFINKKEI